MEASDSCKHRGDLTWPESFADPQRRSPETGAGNARYNNATQAGESKCRNVIICSLAPIIEVSKR